MEVQVLKFVNYFGKRLNYFQFLPIFNNKDILLITCIEEKAGDTFPLLLFKSLHSSL